MKYFNKNSSSFHIVNGDKKLNIFEKILFLILNLINNNFFNKNFDNNSAKKMYYLGNKHFNNLHSLRYNRNLIFKKKNDDLQLYEKKLKKVFKSNNSPSYKNSSFNAQEIKTNFK